MKKGKKKLENDIDYREMLRLIDRCHIKKLTIWLEKNRNKSNFNIDQPVLFQGQSVKPLDLFSYKYPRFNHNPNQLILFKLISSVHPQGGILISETKEAIADKKEFDFAMCVSTIANWLPKFAANSSIMSYRDSQGCTILHRVVLEKDPSLAKHIPELIAKGADPEARDDNCFTPALLAAKNNHVLALKYLAESKVNFTQRAKQANILDLALMWKSMDAYEAIKKILKQRKINLMLTISLRMCVYNRDMNGIVWFLKEDGLVDYEEEDSGTTALMEAVMTGSLDILKILLEGRANPNMADMHGLTAIHRIIVRNNGAMLNCILNPKYNVNLSYATPIFKSTYLHFAVMQNKKQMSVDFLKRKVDVNAKDREDITVIQAAILEDFLEIIDLLLCREGIDIYEKQLYYLNFTLYNGSLAAFQKILSAFPISKNDLVILEKTIVSDKFYHFKYLIERGMDLNLLNCLEIHPFFSLVFLKKNLWLKWVFNYYLVSINPSLVKSSIDIAIDVNNKNIVEWLINNFSHFLNQSDLTLMADNCLKKGWLDIAKILKPALVIFLKSHRLKKLPIRFLLAVIAFLESDFRSLLEFTRFLPKTDQNEFLKFMDLIPAFKECVRDFSEDPGKLKKFLSAEKKKIMPPYIGQRDYRLEARHVHQGQSSHAFFKQQGLDIKNFYPPKSIENKRMPLKLDEKKGSICYWFDNLIRSDDPFLFNVERLNSENVFLYIPERLYSQVNCKKLVYRSRWCFSDKNGLQVIKSRCQLGFTAVVRIGDMVLKRDAHFSLEITSPHTADRILCFEVSPSAGRGRLIIAAFLLDNGLHTKTIHSLKIVDIEFPKTVHEQPCQLSAIDVSRNTF